MVRSPLAGVLVVQGGPGTGKTAVALHRAAYLLYTHRERLARSGVLRRRADPGLPALHRAGAAVASARPASCCARPGSCSPASRRAAVERPEVAVVKGDLRMADVHPQRRPGPPATPARAECPSTSTGDVIAAQAARPSPTPRGRARQGGRPHNEARATFVRHVLARPGRPARRRCADSSADGEDRAELLAELRRRARDVRRELEPAVDAADAHGSDRDLFARPDRLSAAAQRILSPRGARLLLRERGRRGRRRTSRCSTRRPSCSARTCDPGGGAGPARGGARERAEGLEFAREVLEQSPDACSNMAPTAEMLAERFAAGRRRAGRSRDRARRGPHAGRSGTSSSTRPRSCRRWRGGC